MAVASGSLYGKGYSITHVLDMSKALEPAVGSFAVVIFFVGALSAGLSSIFPCLMIVPLMIRDYKSVRLDVQSNTFKYITGVASLFALTVPLFGFNPIKGQIITQAFNVIALPLVIGCIIAVYNRKNLDLPSKKGVLNSILFIAMLFSLIIMTNGIQDMLS